MSLAKETTHAIEAFSKRRRELILVRGLCAFAASVIVIMSTLALLDRMVLMPDRLRWALSLLGYGGIGFILWRICLRHLFGKENLRQTARLIEKARPDLREDLLSAVELGENDDKAEAEHIDSPTFRKLVQQNVAGRVSETKPEDLLPSSLISRWVKGAGIAVAAFVALLFFPHFPQLFSRALLPGANLDRPSDIQIHFIAPDPADRIVPSGDTQPLEVKIVGGDVERVTLETVEDGRTEKVRLSREAGNRFTGAIKVGTADVRYRVRARGSLTRYHTLASRPRPSVSEFAKTYRPPAYSGLDVETVTHEHGDISGLEGTQVTLALSVNQKVTKAELQLKADRKDVDPISIPLETNDDGKLAASFALDGKHTTYKVHLVAAESGFENTFSPFYEIRSVPDLTPKVELAEPQDNRDVRSNEALTMRGSAEDDVALAKVLHAYRINDASWTEVSLAEAPGKFWEFTLQWQLRLLPLKPGDVLVTKLVAIDAKGNRGESAPVRLAVAAEEDNSAEREWAEREKDLADQLAELREETERAAQQTAEAAKVLREDPAERDLNDRQQLVKAEKAAQEAKAKAEQVWEQLEEALADAPNRAEAEQLEAVAAKVAELKDQGLQRLEETMEDAAAGRETPPEDGRHRPEHMAWEAAEAARRAAEAMRAFAAEDHAEVVAEDLAHLAQNQEDIAEAAQGIPADERESLLERQDLARHQAEAMEEELRELSEQLEGGEQNAARNAAQQIEQERGRLDEALAQDNAAERLPDAARNMEQGLEDAARSAAQVAENAERRADEAMRQLQDATDSPSQEVEQLRSEAEQLAQAQQQLDNEQNAARAAELSEDLEEARENFAERAESVADQLADLARAEESSAASNPQEAEDLAQAARALDELADVSADVERAEQARELTEALAELRDAMEVAEAAARADDIAAGLEELAEAEQSLAARQESGVEQNQDSSSADPASQPEADADLAEQVAENLSELPEEIARALEQPQEAQRAAEQAANSSEARELASEMEQRQRSDLRGEEGREEQPQSENIAELQEDIAAIQEALAPQAEQARQQLAQMAPDAREMLRDLAQELGEAAEAAEQLAQQAAATPPTPAAPESGTPPSGEEPAPSESGDPGSPSPAELAESAAEMLAEAEAASESLADISEALADEAGAQDLGSEEGREAARDADDAIAQLDQQAAPEAAAASEALAEAASSQQPQAQSAALQQAAEAQRELASQLEDLAEQLDAIAEGDPSQAEAARTALRDSESETGVEQPLGEAYAQAEDLAELLTAAAEDPQSALAALEQELAGNEAMKAALGELAAEKAMQAAEALAEAAAKESALAEALGENSAPPSGSPDSPAAQQQQAINSAAEQAAADLASAAKHQERLGEKALAESLSESGESAESFGSAQGEGKEALSQLASSPSQSASKPAVESAGQALAQQADSAAQAAAQAAQAAAAQAAQSPASSSEDARSAELLAEALDALDQMMAENSAAGTPSPGAESPTGTPTPGEGSPSPSPASPQAQAAQNALAEAQGQQAAAMAQARAQGQTPGAPSPPQPGSVAQNGQPGQPSGQAQQPNQGTPGSPSVGAGNSAAAQAYLVAAPGSADSDAGEDWSKLPSKVAKDIIEARRQGVAPEYRSAIESYYKAIAERSRGSN